MVRGSRFPRSKYTYARMVLMAGGAQNISRVLFEQPETG